MYIRLSDRAYPLSERDIRAEFPKATFPKPFTAAGFEVVFPTPKPVLEVLERAVETSPVFTTKGVWEQQWEIVDMFSGENKEEQETEYLALLASREKAVESTEALAELNKTDLASIRSLREFILAKFADDPDLPSYLVKHNEDANEYRQKLRS